VAYESAKRLNDSQEINIKMWMTSEREKGNNQKKKSDS
jgi:hypothetical protein